MGGRVAQHRLGRGAGRQLDLLARRRWRRVSAGVITVTRPISTRVATRPTATIAQMTSTTVQPLLHCSGLAADRVDVPLRRADRGRERRPAATPPGSRSDRRAAASRRGGRQLGDGRGGGRTGAAGRARQRAGRRGATGGRRGHGARRGLSLHVQPVALPTGSRRCGAAGRSRRRCDAAPDGRPSTERADRRQRRLGGAAGGGGATLDDSRRGAAWALASKKLRRRPQAGHDVALAQSSKANSAWQCGQPSSRPSILRRVVGQPHVLPQDGALLQHDRVLRERAWRGARRPRSRRCEPTSRPRRRRPGSRPTARRSTGSSGRRARARPRPAASTWRTSSRRTPARSALATDRIPDHRAEHRDDEDDGPAEHDRRHADRDEDVVADVEDHGDEQDGRRSCRRAVGHSTRLAPMTPAIAPLAPIGRDRRARRADHEGDVGEEARQQVDGQNQRQPKASSTASPKTNRNHMLPIRWIQPTCRNMAVPRVSMLWTVTSALTRAGTRPHSCRNGTKRTPTESSNTNASTLTPISVTVAYGQRYVFAS